MAKKENMKIKLFHPATRKTKLVGVSFVVHRNDRSNWLELFFSYETIVAFHESGHKITIAQNIWSNTTGNHLDAIDGGEKKDRISPNAFEGLLDEALQRFFNKEEG